MKTAFRVISAAEQLVSKIIPALKPKMLKNAYQVFSIPSASPYQIVQINTQYVNGKATKRCTSRG
jgi:hypothetical protein